MDKVDGIIFVIVIVGLLISFIGYLATDPSNFQKGRMDQHELTITKVDFTIGDSSTGKIVIQAINSGDFDITIYEIKVNNETSSWEAINSPTLTVGETETFTVTQSIMADTKYSILLFSTEGHLVGSYTEIA